MINSDPPKLEAVLRKFSCLAIVMHDNPDADAISSALALSLLHSKAGGSSRLVARGTVGFEENRLLLSEMDVEPELIDGIFSPEKGEGVALVDNAMPGQNNPLSTDTVPDIILDHHSTADSMSNCIKCAFVHIDPDRCATSSIMLDYLKGMNVDPSPKLASALIYGMMVDSRRYTLPMSDSDFHNLAFASHICDHTLLTSLESPPLDADTMEVLSRAIQNKELTEGFSISCVDYVQNQDTLARSADFLLREKGVHTSMVFGIMKDRVYISTRTNREDLHLGNVLKSAFGSVGFAGGHVHSAGARLPLGILSFTDPDGPEERRAVASIVNRAVANRFLGIVLGGLNADG